MSSPLQNRIAKVFIPVSDIERAIRWYSQIFALPVGDTSHEHRIYDLPMQGEVGLILDAHKPVSNSAQPICLFWCDDIQASQAFLQQHDVELLGSIQDIGSMFILTFRDPDGNLLMIGQLKD